MDYKKQKITGIKYKPICLSSFLQNLIFKVLVNLFKIYNLKDICLRICKNKIQSFFIIKSKIEMI